MKKIVMMVMSVAATATALAANRVFTGAVSGNWSDARNWQDSKMVQVGDYVIDISSRADSTVDFVMGLAISGYEYKGSYNGYQLKGNTLMLMPGAPFINNGMRMYQNCPLVLEVGPHAFNLNKRLDNHAVISGDGGIVLEGASTLVLSSEENAVAGGVDVVGGTLAWTVPQTIPMLSVTNGATLAFGVTDGEPVPLTVGTNLVLSGVALAPVDFAAAAVLPANYADIIVATNGATLKGVPIVDSRYQVRIFDNRLQMRERLDFIVTLGDPPHLAAAWTGGDGSVTNAVDGTSFEVSNGTENVKVIFTADDGWEIVGDAVVDLGTVTENIVFGEGSGFLVPRVQYAPVPYVDIDEVRACDPWGTIAVGYTVDGTDADAKYKVAFEVTAGGRTASVTNDAVKLADGAATNEIDTVALFGKEIGDKDATVKISLIEAVLAPPPAGQLWEGGPIWAENNFGTSEVAEHPEYGALYTLAEATNAVVSIGQGWRVPSKDDFDKLIDDSYCTKGWDDTKKCWTFMGRGEYSSNSIFLAAAGHDYGSGRISGEVLGYYLSSTVDEDPRFPDTFDRNLFFNDVGNIFMTIDYLRYSMSVRAVRDDTEGRTIVDEKVVATAKAEFCLGPLVTVGDHPHMTAAWTSGDGSVTNAIEGVGFTVPKGTTNVRVIFTADHGWEIVGDAVVDLGTVTENIVFGEGSGFLVPRVQYAPVPYVDIDEVRACDPWGTIAVGYTVDGTDADTKYEVAFEVTAGGRTASVTNDAVKLADGAATNEIDTVALFGKEIGDKDATVKILLIEAVLAPPPAGQLWEGGPIWAENNFGTSEVAEHPEYGALYTLAEATNAVVSLGQGWRVPSKDDFDKLIDDSYCTKGWDDTKKGWTFMGRGEYSSNSIFLAAAGHDSGSGRGSGGVLGYYLSSTVDDDPRFPDTFVRNLFFNDGASIFMTIDYLRYSMSVRAVRDDTEGRTIVGEKIVATAKAEFCLEPLVTVGDHPHLAAAWTSGDGSVTNEVEGAGFMVPVGMTDVKVIFTAESGWEIVGDAVVTFETVTENITFGPESGFLVPTVRHEAVKYIDADGVERTKSAGEFDVVTEETRFLTNGWYAVIEDVDIVAKTNIVVEGDVHLIFCDGASLMVTNAAAWTAAVAVEDGASLSVYGQADGTGRLTAKGGNRAAGIGCAHQKDCGTISIHGGVVTATGGSYGAGIGSSSSCSNGCVVVTGGRIAAAKGNSQGSDIGNGGGKTTGCAVSISGGIFANPVDVAWCAEGYAPVANPDPNTAADYPYTVRPAYRVTIGEHPNVTAAWTCGDKSVTNEIEGVSFGVMPPGTNGVMVIFSATDSRCALDGESVVNIGAVTGDVVFGVDNDFAVPRSGVRYLDWDAGRNLATNAMVGVEDVTWVTTTTKKLADGKWYAVFGEVALTNSLPVEGSAHLILCDWATLAITNSAADAAVSVGEGAVLSIYGQAADTGRLEVMGGTSGAGIGGRNGGKCGAIAIHGGTITANGDKYCAGIGSGGGGIGGSVTITGGRIAAQGGNGAEDIGSGYSYFLTPCTVSISGGIFAREVKDAWLADGCVVVPNKDVATAAEYPYAVLATYPVSWNGNADKMSIHVQIDGKTVTDNPVAVLAGDVVEFIVLPKPGYEYAAAPEGWSLRTDGGICNRFEVVDDSIEVKIPDPTGEPITYTITYFDYGEWIDGFEPVTEYTFETETFNLPVAGDIAPRMGGMFQCWTNEVGETVSEVVQGTEGNLNFYAVWKSAGADPIQAIIGDKVDGFVDLSSEEQKAVYDNVHYLYSQFLDVDRTEAWIATVYGDGAKVPAAKFAATTEELVKVSFKYGLPIMAPPVTIHVTTAKEDLGFTFAITDGDKDAVSVKAADLYRLVKYTGSLDDEFHMATEAEVTFDANPNETFTARFVEGPSAGFMKAELIVPDPAED